jgi:hypothetical protein
MPPMTNPAFHTDLVWRPAGGADQIVKSYDNTPGMNINDMPSLPAVAAACGDQLVVRTRLVSTQGSTTVEIGAKLTIP